MAISSKNIIFIISINDNYVFNITKLNINETFPIIDILNYYIKIPFVINFKEHFNCLEELFVSGDNIIYTNIKKLINYIKIDTPISVLSLNKNIFFKIQLNCQNISDNEILILKNKFSGKPPVTTLSSVATISPVTTITQPLAKSYPVIKAVEPVAKAYPVTKATEPVAKTPLTAKPAEPVSFSVKPKSLLSSLTEYIKESFSPPTTPDPVPPTTPDPVPPTTPTPVPPTTPTPVPPTTPDPVPSTTISPQIYPNKIKHHSYQHTLNKISKPFYATYVCNICNGGIENNLLYHHSNSKSEFNSHLHCTLTYPYSSVYKSRQNNSIKIGGNSKSKSKSKSKKKSKRKNNKRKNI